MSAFLRSRAGLVLLASLAIAGFFLIMEHWAHFSGVLPYVLLVVFMALHHFMHGGHGGHGGGESGDDEQQERTEGEKQ